MLYLILLVVIFAGITIAADFIRANRVKKLFEERQREWQELRDQTVSVIQRVRKAPNQKTPEKELDLSDQTGEFDYKQLNTFPSGEWVAPISVSYTIKARMNPLGEYREETFPIWTYQDWVTAQEAIGNAVSNNISSDYTNKVSA